jgi:glycosyltransferase involved in cell wall biosynthesis
MVSILIPIYNGIEYINESVSSVLEQTYDDWEIIIGVNGHQENSNVYKMARDYQELDEKIKVLDLFEIKGKSNALNEMIKYCKYEYVAILDVDDIWLPEKLEKQAVYMNQYDVIGTQCVYFGDIENINPKIPLGDISSSDFTQVNPIINSSVIIKKNLCNWISDFDGVEDYDMWLRLRKQRKTFFNIEEVLVKHRIHKQSAFNSQNQQAKLVQILNNYKFG